MTDAAERLAQAARLARRELRSGLTGFRILILCLALGVATIAGVGSVSEAMLQGLARDAAVLLGGDMEISIVHREATEEQRDYLRSRAEVSEVVEMRAMATAEAEPPRRTLVELKAVDARYPLYGEVRLEPPGPLGDALARRDGAWGAVVERGLLLRLDREVGDRVLVGGTAFRIAGILEREPDKALRGFALGPTLLISEEALAATGLVKPGSLIHYHYRLKLPPETGIAAMHDDLGARFPEAGWRIRDVREGAPRVDRFIRRLTLFLTLLGLTSLVVAGLGVSNAVRGYLEGRTRTIAILKCLGAPSSLIFLTYLIQVGTLAAAGIGLGLILGALGPWLVAEALGESLGWQLAVGLYPVPLALAGAFGVLTTLAFSLLPLTRACVTPPASLYRVHVSPHLKRLPRLSLLALVVLGAALAALAIATANDPLTAAIYVAGALGALALFGLVARGLMALARRWGRAREPGLRLAIANLHRPGAPTPAVVMSLGLGITLLVAVAVIEDNLSRQIHASMPRQAPEFYFIDIQPQQLVPFIETVRAVPGAAEIEHMPMLRGRITGVNGVRPSDMEIPPDAAWVFRGDRGLTWRRTPTDDELVAGDWWSPDYDGPPLVSLAAGIGEALEIGPGDTLTVNILGRDVTVEIANLREVDWSSLTLNFVMVFSPGLLESAPQTHIATVQAEQGALDRIETAVAERFANISAVRVEEALQQAAVLLERISVAIRLTASVAILAGILVLAGAVAADHRRRAYDAVILKVLGATRHTVARIFAIEYGLMGLVIAALAAVVGTVAGFAVMTEVMRSDFEFALMPVLATALVALAITMLLGFAGIWRVLGQEAAPLLRNE